jgi:hypothetical protein
MFDVFYLNRPSGLFPHERSADSIDHAIQLSRTRYLWIVDAANDYSGFDWLWEPVPWESAQAHVWPSQHQANGGTWLIPKAGYQDVNRNHNMISRRGSAPRLHVYHGAVKSGIGDYDTRYIADYLGTLRRALSKIDAEYCWVTADICDYQDFDFTWHPSEWQADMLHVFPSNEQKFGDTFYIHVPSFLEKSKNLALLEWFDTIHFVEDLSVSRKTIPVVQHTDDSHVEKIKNEIWTDPLKIFSTVPVTQKDLPTISLWREKTKTVIPLAPGSSTLIVPRTATSYVKTQVYDYPYIDKTYQHILTHRHQDIVFIDYDEPQAEKNWQILQTRFPRSKRISGVSGMENALVAAARISSTPWYFAVFAKTELADTFDFSFAPDYMQKPKHYIFDCKNIVNGLTYGHMGVVLYNVGYVLLEKDYQELDLDYTLSFPHEVVSELSCLGRFDSSAYHTWRTAFRECAKLSLYNFREPLIDTQYRLDVWKSTASGPYAEWCLRGANDGINFFKETQGDMTLMKQSFKWEWLRQRFVERYGDID